MRHKEFDEKGKNQPCSEKVWFKNDDRTFFYKQFMKKIKLEGLVVVYRETLKKCLPTPTILTTEYMIVKHGCGTCNWNWKEGYKQKRNLKV